MDSNLSPPLLQPPSRNFPSISDDKYASLTSQNDTHNGDNASSNGFRGSIAERRAAKFGFKAERISTPRFRTTSPLNSPAASGARSPCITIPPGISPTALLDSPMMLPNAQPSPTTGTFPLSHLNYGGSTMLDGDMDNISDTFRFKPHADSFVGFATIENQGQGNNSDFRAVDFEFPVDVTKEDRIEKYAGDSATDLEVLNSMNENAKHSKIQTGHTDAAGNQIEPIHGENIGSHHPLTEDKGTFAAIGVGRNSEDGYNWRKYGQKQVKGSEYPRSYYKCTNPSCEVKKKIERSYDGQITEIIYKGTHNHLKPQPSRRPQLGSASSCNELADMNASKGEVRSAWKSLPNGSDWKLDGHERTSSASVVTELSDPFSAVQGKSAGTFDSVRTPDFSSTLKNNDDVDDDDGATQGSISLGADADVDADADESESKRRKVESCLVESSLTSRAIREPRVVVQIESEIDILDDGYRWRKYGQKVVKGNPNPRSYYKCTSTGCSVRKHVERASHNLKYVITTYEGKHNHEVPAARNSTNSNSTNNNSQPVVTISGNLKPEKSIQDYAPGFDRKPMVNNEYMMRQVFPGNFSKDLKHGMPSNYPLKFPPTFQHTVPFTPFELNQCAIQQSGSLASLVPDFAFSMPQSLRESTNLSLAGAEFGYNVIGQNQPSIAGQQMIRPKQEQRDENMYDAAQSIMDHVNASPSSSFYHHMMGNFPS